MASQAQYDALVAAYEAEKNALMALFQSQDSQIAVLTAQVLALQNELANSLTAAQEDDYLAQLNAILVELQAITP